MGNEQSKSLESAAQTPGTAGAQLLIDAAAAVIEQVKRDTEQKCFAALAEKRKATVESASEDEGEAPEPSKRSHKKRKSAIDKGSQSGNTETSKLPQASGAATNDTTSITTTTRGKKDLDPVEPIARTAKAKTKAHPPALYKATLISRADVDAIRVTGSTSDIDNGIIKRIKSCLDRGNHHTTPEREAKVALLMADKLMTQFKITTAEVFAHLPASDQQKHAGHSVVRITRIDEDRTKPVKYFAYVSFLAQAMEKFFNVIPYSSKPKDSRHLDWTFNGIAENTVAAAMALEMVFNLIAEWARSRKGSASKNSYCLGTSQELCRMAKEARRLEEEQAKKADEDAFAGRVIREEAERQAQLDRPAPLPDTELEGSTSHDGASADGASPEHMIFLGDGAQSSVRNLGDDDSDAEDHYNDSVWEGFPDDEAYASDNEADFIVDDEEEVGSFGDLDDDLDKLAEAQQKLSEDSAQSKISQENDIPASMPGLDSVDTSRDGPDAMVEPQSEQEKEWASHMQVMTYRETATKIAEDHIKEHCGKLKKGRKRSTVVRDQLAYNEGVEDGKKIDVYRRTIKESEGDEGLEEVTLVKHKTEEGPWFKLPGGHAKLDGV